MVSWIKHSVDRFVIVSIFIPKLRLILILNSFLGSSDSLVFSELFHSLAPRPLAARSISDFLLTYLAKFFACLVRFESSSVPTTLPTAYDVYPLDGRHDGGYYTVKDCVTIDVLPRTPGNNVYVGFMVWSNFTATKCRGLVSLNQVI